jgi:hypothetical protein
MDASGKSGLGAATSNRHLDTPPAPVQLMQALDDCGLYFAGRCVQALPDHT